MGFDEGLYRDYVNALIEDGITSYPNIVEAYGRRKDEKTEVILPPFVFSLFSRPTFGIDIRFRSAGSVSETSLPFLAC